MAVQRGTAGVENSGQTGTASIEGYGRALDALFGMYHRPRQECEHFGNA
jgi:hypothetical protein